LRLKRERIQRTRCRKIEVSVVLEIRVQAKEACNNKPPHVSAEPYNLHYKYPDAPNVWNFELSIAAECANDEWVWLKTQTYQRPLAEWTTLINRLKAAWTAAEGIK